MIILISSIQQMANESYIGILPTSTIFQCSVWVSSRDQIQQNVISIEADLFFNHSPQAPRRVPGILHVLTDYLLDAWISLARKNWLNHWPKSKACIVYSVYTRLKHQLSIYLRKIWTALTRDEVQNSKFNHTYHIYYKNNLIFI